MENVCRTCLRAQKDFLSLYNDGGTLIHKLETIASIEVIEGDNFPKTICTECVTNINRFYNFRTVIINSDKELKERQKILLKFKKEEKIEKADSENAVPEMIEEKFHIDEMNVQDECCKNEVEEGVNNLTPIKEENIVAVVPPAPENKSSGSEMKLKEAKVKESKSSMSNQLDIIKRLLRRFYQCPMCDEKFPTRLKLTYHKRTMHVKSGICNICGVVIRADNLKKHLQIHSVAPVKCKDCGKLYKNIESLRGHSLIHKNESFPCQVCGKAFQRKNIYIRHLKIHTEPEVRKKVCSICNKRVARMKKHMQIHTGEKPYNCKLCNKGLCSAYSLKLHMRQHTNEKPFDCPHCSNSFYQKSSLQTHLKSKHNVHLK